MNNLDEMAKIYIDYYNNNEDGCWSEEKAKKRIAQMITINDSNCLCLYNDEEKMIGFILGYYREFDDLLGYCLDEIIVDLKYQNQGYGKLLMEKLEETVESDGASMIELTSVNDEHHKHFYKKCGFYISDNFIQMSKFIK